ncbi:RICIN domain-containing protein [Actinoallomurus soli]|uniref:RICIN domain-containing protein n=1 Tax=Actinoallomurus soli TaxID=2952535 RepID=UPI002092AA4B|nr:RICIN domain-containing protein [Actinoallomurus soli]MCO5974570.1 RICIN domain-containing protein [Actinoallomurus soli]
MQAHHGSTGARPARNRPSIGRAGLSVLAAAGALGLASIVWAVTPAAGADVGAGTYTVTNAGSGLCLDLPGSSSASGVQLDQSACNGADAQKWTLSSASGGYTIKSVGSGLCAGVRGASTSAGKAIEQETCTGAAGQIWTLAASGGGYHLVNANGGKCANIADNSTAAGALVQTNSCDSVATKQWTLAATGGGGGTTPPTSPPPTTPPDGLIGWATQNGGTTGGAGGPTVTVTTLDALNQAVAASGPEIIRVNGNFTCSADVRIASNKTVLGVGSGSGLTGCGLNMRKVSNVIVRNLKISKVLAGNGNGDAIHIEQSTNLWIDHNDLSSDLDHDIDYYDGLLDITHAADYITVSWNILHDHYKCSLVGHSDSNASEDTGHLRVTYHHNEFRNCYERNPRVRFGNPVHVFNNYYFMGGGPDHYSYAIASTENAGILVEGNYFEGVSDPTHLGEGDSSAGSLVARNNVLVNSGTILTAGTVASIPYPYTVDDPNTVKSTVTAGAGTGKITT